jgi:cytidylate kinase
VPLQDILENLRKRDLIDSTRKESPLVRAADADILDTSHITIVEQVDFVLHQVAAKIIKSEFSLPG